MKMHILVLILLATLSGYQTVELVCPVTQNSCPYENVAILKTTKASQDNHYYIGGLFGVHETGDTAYECSTSVRDRGFVNMVAFFWAINYYKTTAGPEVDIGGVAFDNCGRQEQAIENVLSFAQCKLRPEGVERRQLLAYVGPDRSSEAIALGRTMTDLNITYISHSATSPELRDSKRIPYFLRTVPSDANDALIMAQMVIRIDTKYVMIIYMDDAYGRAGKELFTTEMQKSGKCVVEAIRLPVNPTPAELREVTNMLIAKQVVKYVALYTDATHARVVLEAVNAENSIANKFIFLGTSSWGRNNAVIKGLPEVVFNNSIVIATNVAGSFGSTYGSFKTYWQSLKPNTTMPNIVNPWFNQYWEQKFQCSLLNNAPNKCDIAKQALTEEDLNGYVPYTIMAVAAIVDGVKRAARESCSQRYELCSPLMNNDNRGTQIYEAIKQFKDGDSKVFNTQVDADGKYVSADVTGKFSEYNVYSISNGQYTEIGKYVNSTGLTQSKILDKTYYPGGRCPDTPCLVCNEAPPTQAPTSTTPASASPTTTTRDPTEGGKLAMVYYPAMQEITGAYASQNRTDEEYLTRFEIGQKWIIALGVLAGLGIFAVFVFEIYVMYKLLGTHNSQKWRTVWLGQLLLFGIFLSYLTLFAYIPIPTKATCGITRFGVGVSYAIMFAVLLVKLMVILTSKASESLLPGDMESPNYLKGIYQFLMFMFAVGVQVVIAIQWLITVPPEAIQVTDNRGEKYWICNHYTWAASSGWMDMRGFIRTEFENHVLSLIYIMVLILITTILALKSHGIITNNRESIFIGISAGFSIPIWLAWTLVGGLNRDHGYAQEFGDCCIAIGLFLTATLILFAMFLPKVRQLVNMGVEGIYFEDDRDTVYNESVILAPPSYKSRPGSVIYVNNPGLYSDPIHLNGDPGHHLKYNTAGSVYSSPPGIYRKADSTIGPSSKVLRVTGDLTGKHPAERKRTQSDYGYGGRSVKGTLTRSRSHQNIGAL